MARTMRMLPALLTGLALSLTACAEDDSTNDTAGGDDAPTQDADGGAPAEEGPIKIGAVLDITGAGASLGVPERQTLEMLAEQVNAEGGVNGREIELIIEDNQSTEDGAARVTNKLLQTDEVDILLGASRTGPSLAMRPIAEQAEIPMISLAANIKIVEGAEWIFKTAQNDRVVIERMVEDMAAKGYEEIVLVRDASAFGEGVAELFTELGGELGIELIGVESFAPDASDFTAQMVNVRDADPDAVVIWGIPPATSLAQVAYRQLDVPAPVYQSHGIGNQVFLDSAGDAADGLIAPLGRMLVADQLPEDDPQKEVVTQFIADFEETYGESPSTFAGHAYDGFMIAINALREVGTDPAALRDTIEGVSNWPGISGVFTMTPDDHSGLSKDALVMVTVENGEWQLAED
ncbi:MAG TPA: ABC transporter substrate-binding protein [Jiangellaceae bacterium]